MNPGGVVHRVVAVRAGDLAGDDAMGLHDAVDFGLRPRRADEAGIEITEMGGRLLGCVARRIDRDEDVTRSVGMIGAMRRSATARRFAL